MNILFLGYYTGTSRTRADALKRLGHQVHIVNPETFVPKAKLLNKLNYETGGILFSNDVARQVREAIKGHTFDLTWVEQGRYINRDMVRELQERFGPVINYNNDDPLGYRDRFSWTTYRQAIPVYDLLIFHREINVKEAYAAGARKAIWVYSVIDEVAHAPRIITPEEYEKYHSDVLFMGTWMPERGPFMKALVDKGFSIAIYGHRWEKAAEWPVLQKYWKGLTTTSYDDYARAIQTAKICLGLLSVGNRDLHTRRSMEIPSLGGLFCAQRTPDHLALYEEGVEAVFWSDVNECADLCVELLQDEPRRQRIAAAGQERCRKNGNYNEPFLRSMIQMVKPEELQTRSSKI